MTVKLCDIHLNVCCVFNAYDIILAVSVNTQDRQAGLGQCVEHKRGGCGLGRAAFEVGNGDREDWRHGSTFKSVSTDIRISVVQ